MRRMRPADLALESLRREASHREMLHREASRLSRHRQREGIEDEEGMVLGVPVCGKPREFEREEALRRVNKFGYNLRYVRRSLKGDRGVVLAAVRSFGSALQFAAPYLREDRDLVLTAINAYGPALQFASGTLRDDKNLVLFAIERHEEALQFASDRLREDREVVLAAVTRNAKTFRHAGPALKSDRDFVVRVLHASKRAAPLKYVSEDLRRESRLLIAGLSVASTDESLEMVLGMVPERLCSCRDFMFAAVKCAGVALALAGPEQRRDVEIVRAAVKQNPRAFEFVSEDFRDDREIIRLLCEGFARRDDPETVRDLLPRDYKEQVERWAFAELGGDPARSTLSFPEMHARFIGCPITKTDPRLNLFPELGWYMMQTFNEDEDD